MVWLNEESQDAYPSNEVEMDGLLPGKFVIQVSFNADTIADWVKTIKLKKNEQVVYKIVKMNKISKEAGKVGRSIKKSEDSSGDDLIQYYKLVRQKEK